ncbi:hypothetical protein M2480_000204 [Parabacteroides sp. PFB2-12]|uniref:hypothetical protein n=1 Tax=unclassified Parabacteroides TaxID=2649774 RepID=UPI002475FF36|nr:MULTISPECIES: hypothetical protein [unclassified Parabacteroides]MDH6341452.1 hypothetical protein [Parabacteroides sp. PM6-13]MDH6389246.1 hypothetical protein [Parabacteroides sp. PFB2-12]MDL2309780.1 hypothetical protein [Parabacteroides sp. OttesenSCG-928-B22]
MEDRLQKLINISDKQLASMQKIARSRKQQGVRDYVQNPHHFSVEELEEQEASHLKRESEKRI